MKPEDNSDQQHHYLLPSERLKSVLQPMSNPAADLVRKKIEALYAKEPDTKEELAENQSLGRKHLSRHQVFIRELSQSGKALPEIQTAWHNYYVALPDEEKHQVWREFYEVRGQANQKARAESTLRSANQPAAQPSTTHPRYRLPRPAVLRSIQEIKDQLLSRINARGRLKASHHLKSVAFGLVVGSFSVILLLFGFFNERVIAPFITPSRAISSTPIIIDPNTAAVDPNPKIIIPKINVEIPVVYDEPSVDEKAVQKALERGVVHYATTPSSGEKGNSVIFGHSSNNILNPGKYKFAFVLLSRLEAGDTFYLTKDSKQYVYRVYEKRIVKPEETWVLGPRDKPATATLITCDPPGTTISRLIVVGEQVSPDPSGNSESTAIKTDAQPTIVPSNAPTLWQRILNWFRD